MRTSLESVGQFGRLETQADVDGTVLRQNFFLPGEPQVLLLRPSNYWTRCTHVTKGSLFYLESTDSRS